MNYSLLNLHKGVLNHILVLFLSFDAHLYTFSQMCLSILHTHPQCVKITLLHFLIHFLSAFILFFFFTKATLIGMRRYIIICLINISMIIMHSFHGLEGQWDVFL